MSPLLQNDAFKILINISGAIGMAAHLPSGLHLLLLLASNPSPFVHFAVEDFTPFVGGGPQFTVVPSCEAD